MTTTDKPLFDTCDENSNSHYAESAWGFTWCECDHTAIINYRNARGGVELTEGEYPDWWRDALAEAFANDPLGALHDSAANFEHVWSQLKRLHDDIASPDGTWDRWDEFDAYWNEDGLRLLERAGIASVVVGDWDHQDYKKNWHGKDCGCLEIDFELQAERTSGGA